jgi:hypothetical protein
MKSSKQHVLNLGIFEEVRKAFTVIRLENSCPEYFETRKCKLQNQQGPDGPLPLNQALLLIKESILVARKLKNEFLLS